nr:general odorant-binding protein 56d-like [Nomia melanderi]
MFGHRLLPLVLAVALISLDPIGADIRKDCRRESKVSWGNLSSIQEFGRLRSTVHRSKNVPSLFNVSASLRRMKSGNFEHEDPKLKCYVKCFMVRHGILNDNAEIDVQRALRHIPRSLQASSKQLFNKCKSVPATDSCDKAYQMAKCYVKTYPEILQTVPLI